MALINRMFINRLFRGSGKPSLDRMLAQFDKELDNFTELILPAPESKPRTPFDNENLPFQ